MMDNEDTLEMIAINEIVITMHEPVTDREARYIIEEAERIGMQAVVHNGNRIFTFEVADPEDMEDIIGITGDLGITEDIGLIRMITSLEPQWVREATYGGIH